jgi:hypothetical protein
MNIFKKRGEFLVYSQRTITISFAKALSFFAEISELVLVRWTNLIHHFILSLTSDVVVEIQEFQTLANPFFICVFNYFVWFKFWFEKKKEAKLKFR